MINRNMLEPSVGYFTKADSFKEVISGDLSETDLTFNIVKPVPGTVSFSLPWQDICGQNQVETITGVIVYHHNMNSFYDGGFSGEGKRADCYSMDGKLGIGSPGGSCAVCPLNRYGTDGRGKACKNRKKIYIQREDDAMPFSMIVPTSSLRLFNDYVSKRIVPCGLRLNKVVTKISIRQEKAPNGGTYYKLVFDLDRVLSCKEIESIEYISEQVKNNVEKNIYNMETSHEPSSVVPF